MKEIIKSKAAPAPIGPYNQAVKAGGFIFVSGQLPVVTETGELISGDVAKATEKVLTHIKNILEEAGSSLENVVKVNVFLKNMDDFTLMNDVYKKFFTENEPARAAIQVAKLPKDADVEIECVALA